MSNLKDDTINEIIRIEGGYSNDGDDSGGETNFGITKAVARSFGYLDDMQLMPWSVAYDIYAAKYWDVVRADNIVELSERVAIEIVDTSVNMGHKRAAKFLQRSLNVLNDRERLYDDIVVDGSIGPGTIAALFSYLEARSESTLVKMLNCLQGSFYVVLSEKREKDEKWINGWFNNRVVI